VQHDELAISVCREFAKSAPDGVVFKEPYLPYVPTAWNGVLVLGCAENLGAKTIAEKYRQRLLAMKSKQPESLFHRLHGDDVPGRPWGDDRIKLSLRAIWPKIDFQHLAFSNAVPWSITTAGKGGKIKDTPPTPEMVDHAVDFWCSLMPALGWSSPTSPLKLIITVHAISRDVASKVKLKESLSSRLFSLYFPCPRNDNKISSRYNGELDQRVREAVAAMGIKPQPRDERYATYALAEAEKQLGTQLQQIL
jgi:hypothetical protein